MNHKRFLIQFDTLEMGKIISEILRLKGYVWSGSGEPILPNFGNIGNAYVRTQLDKISHSWDSWALRHSPRDRVFRAETEMGAFLEFLNLKDVIEVVVSQGKALVHPDKMITLPNTIITEGDMKKLNEALNSIQ